MANAGEKTLGKGEPSGSSYVPQLDPEERRRRNRAAMELLDRWELEGDAEEQRETMEILREALGKNRTISNRPLFP